MHHFGTNCNDCNQRSAINKPKFRENFDESSQIGISGRRPHWDFLHSLLLRISFIIMQYGEQEKMFSWLLGKLFFTRLGGDQTRPTKTCTILSNKSVSSRNVRRSQTGSAKPDGAYFAGSPSGFLAPGCGKSSCHGLLQLRLWLLRNNLRARVQHAQILLGQGKAGDAVAQSQSLPGTQDAAPAHYVLGLAYLRNGQLDQASAELETATRLSHGMAVAWRSLAELHL